ncbi:hypothetical protein BDR07DRAFT_1377705 [Suillus spraguei]|nr:hypothetical protein BDR07DRAFT_1383178 [Suillus spraguei]KAG2360791.1 hypothetical protein BDR07DRAFT_1377705 [Suillus spraguei]
MSNMIPSGNYHIRNVQYPNRYISLSGNQFVGHDTANTFCVDVKDVVPHLATLKEDGSGLYLTLDVDVGLSGVDSCEIANSMKLQDHKVLGKKKPETLQLSSSDGKQFEIMIQGVNEVAYLQDDNNGSHIYVGPAPESGKRQYWKFEKA